MNLQYISDKNGEVTGVYIPISEWNKLKSKFKDLESLDIPSWQVEEVDKRVEEYHKNPSIALNLDEVMDDIEKKL